MVLNRNTKRLLSLVLCLVMCFSLLPAAAFADVGDESAQTQESGGADNDLPGEGGGVEPGENKASDDETPKDPLPSEEETPSVPNA